MTGVRTLNAARLHAHHPFPGTAEPAMISVSDVCSHKKLPRKQQQAKARSQEAAHARQIHPFASIHFEPAFCPRNDRPLDDRPRGVSEVNRKAAVRAHRKRKSIHHSDTRKSTALTAAQLPRFGDSMKHIGFPSLVIHAMKAIIFVVLTVELMNPFNCAYAQTSSSGLSGVITDSSGAAVSAAEITIRNVATNVERKTTSNSSGDYFFTSLPPARYTLIVAAGGFQKETVSTFEVGVAQVATVNVALKVGSTSQSITVEAANTEVESSTSQLGTQR
jgi:hypothetical protein